MFWHLREVIVKRYMNGQLAISIHTYIYIYTCTHAYIFVYVCIYIYTYIHVYIYIYKQIYICIYICKYIIFLHIYTFTHVYIYICICIYIYTCTHIHMYIYNVYMNMYIYIYMAYIYVLDGVHHRIPCCEVIAGAQLFYSTAMSCSSVHTTMSCFRPSIIRPVHASSNRSPHSLTVYSRWSICTWCMITRRISIS